MRGSRGDHGSVSLLWVQSQHTYIADKGRLSFLTIDDVIKRSEGADDRQEAPS
jgi:hypothetical protein